MPKYVIAYVWLYSGEFRTVQYKDASFFTVKQEAEALKRIDGVGAVAIYLIAEDLTEEKL